MIKRARVLVALILVGGFALLAVGCDHSNVELNHNASTANGNRSEGSTASGATGEMERQFILAAASGGMAEVELGRMAAQKAADNEVKQFGQRMVDDHSRANAELKQVASRKNVTLPAELDSRHRDLLDRLGKLSGSEFDRAYMDEMLEDHTKDVSEFERASTQAQDADVKGFAGKTLPTLREHLEMAKTIQGRVAGATKPNLRRVGNTNSPR
jgi:putative membrane protein